MTGTGERFAAIRAALGLNQSDMADKAGVRRDSWRRYEAGALPNGETLERIAGMGFSIDWLITGRGEMRQTLAASDITERAGDKLLGLGAREIEAIPLQPIPHDLEEALEAVAVALRWGPQGYRVALVLLQQLTRMIEDQAREG